MQAYRLTDVGMVEFGFLLNTSIVIVVSLHLAVETLHWVILSSPSTPISYLTLGLCMFMYA